MNCPKTEGELLFLAIRGANAAHGTFLRLAEAWETLRQLSEKLSEPRHVSGGVVIYMSIDGQI